MRHIITKRSSTRAERLVYEVLKELKVSFKHRWMVGGREVDFIIGNIALEINGHGQYIDKNHQLVEAGYIPIHLSNKETENRKHLTNIIKQLI